MILYIIIALGLVKIACTIINRPGRLRSRPELPEPIEIEPAKPGPDKADLIRADIERYKAIKSEYMDLLDSIQNEIELIQAGPDTIQNARRKTTLISRRAAITEKVYKLDRKIEIEYNKTI